MRAILSILLLLATLSVSSEEVTIFRNSSVGQHDFAANNIKTVLLAKGHTATIVELSSLSESHSGTKVVLVLREHSAIVSLFAHEGGVALPVLSEQAYALRTTTTAGGTNSYWVFGGDNNGAMYGGLQLAESIGFDTALGVYNSEESPTILKRGIKLNLPFDKNSTTYFSSNNSSSAKEAISNVWDMTFWTTWFDEMARYRYNVLSVWNNHPFTSMIKMDDYPNVAIADVTGYTATGSDRKIKTMTIDEKIVFWKKVMAYAHARGFEFYLFNWNLFCGTANGQYGITQGSAGVSNANTVTYMRKAMTKLLETYPDLDGFGITQGESMSGNDSNDSKFLGDTFGKGMADYAKINHGRKLRFIHRWHMADFTLIKTNFAELMALPNVTFEMSYKYCQAHMYSVPVPTWMPSGDVTALKTNNIKSWLTVRNDDFYFHNWGDPAFVRSFVNGIPGQGDWFSGFYMGSDGFHQTRSFYSKNSVVQGLLDVQRMWYMYQLWGRLSYNPSTSDEVFMGTMAQKYSGVSSNDLFEAWNKASRGLPKVTELIQGTMKLDMDWYPEACCSKDGFITAADFGSAKVAGGSNLCTIATSGANSCGNKQSSYALADEIEIDAQSALAFAGTLMASDNTHLGVAINNIKLMSYLTIYYAYKIRGATYLASGESGIEQARSALATGYTYWLNYINLMEKNYFPVDLQRTTNITNWHQFDNAVLADFDNSYKPQPIFNPKEGTLKDADNNEYRTLQYGTQEWTVENWKCTKYNDGTAITFGNSSTIWSAENNAMRGAYTNYPEVAFETYKANYGLLYNWWTVYSEKLAPAGWRVPSVEDFDTLRNYLVSLGFNYTNSLSGNDIGKAMADVSKTVTAPWSSNSSDGTPGNFNFASAKNNISRFSALPMGRVNNGYGSGSLGTGMFMWTTTHSGMDASTRTVTSSTTGLNSGTWNKGYGACIRLVRTVPLGLSTSRPILFELYMENGRLTIQSEEIVLKIEVFDMEGIKQLETANSSSLNIEGLVPGSYLVRITCPDEMFVRKIVKTKR